jgi:parallel beta-helix repeat protein
MRLPFLSGFPWGTLILVSALLAALAAPPGPATGAEVPEVLVTNNLVLEKGASLGARLIVRADHVTIDGNGATLVGPGTVGHTNSLAEAGIGVLVEGATGVTLKNLRARGFATGLVMRDVTAATVMECDFSDNYHNPGHGWGELPARGGILLERVRHCVIRQCRANRVWDALHLIDSDDNLVQDNNFSKCSNTCAKLWKSSRNKFLGNNLSYGLRIDRSAGEVHARDSTGVLIETASNDNYWFQNDITHGGDGIFIRPLNRWVSRGNVFVENDTSYANNNCIESWSPGNIYIRNKANHGSYGFWLGGSDHTVLIGNEAAYNGLTNGFHNAPEPGFSHGGIVIVGGPSSHTIITGNYLHDNNGAGLAFRGDAPSRGAKWRTEHWIIQRNRIENNRFGIWGGWGDAILLAGNVMTNNSRGNYLTNVANLVELAGPGVAQPAPIAELRGPEVAWVGRPVRFDASNSRDLGGRPLNYRWYLGGEAGREPVLERVFHEPGFHRLGLTVENGSLAALAWRDLLVAEPVARELGTEGQAALWGFELEMNEGGRGRVHFADDAGGLCGTRCLRITPNPYPGAYATAIFPAARDANWNFSTGKRIRFWIQAENPNIPGWQNAGPVVRLLGPDGAIEYQPANNANLLNDPPFSEARWLWMPISIPLAGDRQWQRKVTGTVSLDRINALSLAFDSWGGDPFTVRVDGLTVDDGDGQTKGGTAMEKELLKAIELALTDKWDAAHAIVQGFEGDATASWIHAVLHKIEGDMSNSRYWYRRAERMDHAGDEPKGELRLIQQAIQARAG